MTVFEKPGARKKFDYPDMVRRHCRWGTARHELRCGWRGIVDAVAVWRNAATVLNRRQVREAGKKALADAKIDYSLVEQACVGYGTSMST